MFLGLFIFLAGAFFGSIVDSFVFKGQSWDQTFFSSWFKDAKPGSPARKNLPEPTPGNSATELTIHSNPQLPSPKDSPEGGLPKNVVVPSFSLPVLEIPDGKKSTSASPGASFPDAGLPSPSDIVVATNVADLVAAIGSTPSLPETALPASPLASSVEPANPAPLPTSSRGLDYRLAFKKVQPLEEAAGTNYHGSFSHDGNVLIFSSNRPTDENKERYQCYIREMKSNAPAVRLFSWSGNVWTPEFSNDGRLLVFSSDSVAREHVFLRDKVTQQVKQLTEGDSKNMMPVISPDGKYVAFTSNRKGNNDIWLIGTDGSGLVQVTSGPEDDREPRWWPDGSAIVFTRIVEKMKVSNIMKVSLDPMGSPEKLVAENHRDWMPDVSPDSRYLSYVRSEKTDGSGNIIRIKRLDSNEEFEVQPFKGGEHYRPIWKATGDGLVFHTDKGKKKCLYLAVLQKDPKR